ncbi:MAG: DUF1501 domain-containing protein [Pirellulaceae bacterium]
MLTIFSTDRMNRRAMLTVGSLGLGGLSLSHLLAANEGKPITTGKSVIFLLQHGGPTQFETFDPKLDVPDGIRTVGGVTRTRIPGVTFGSTMQHLAGLADKCAIVRSYRSGSNAHSTRPIIGEASLKANMGSLYARLAGTNHPQTGMPMNVTLYPNSIDPQALGADDRFGKFTQTGTLSKSYEPFVPGGGSELQKNLQLAFPVERFQDRRALLSALDNLKSEVDASGTLEGLDRFRQQAYEMVVQGVAKSFDLSRESPGTIARYDTSQWINEKAYAHKSNGDSKRRWYQNNALTLGKLLLMARRLCEAGCGFVTITTRFVWDMHADRNNLGVEQGMAAVGAPFDHAVSAFIEDCEARGLGDKIMLVSTGEMGRTPRINKNGGRDHWGRLTPLFLYGGGITKGQVIGKSTRDGGEPATHACDSNNLLGTIMHTLFDMGELRIKQGLPNELVQHIASATPISGLGQ